MFMLLVIFGCFLVMFGFMSISDFLVCISVSGIILCVIGLVMD